MNTDLESRLLSVLGDVQNLSRQAIEILLDTYLPGRLAQLEARNHALERHAEILEVANDHLKKQVLALKAELAAKQPKPTDLVMGYRDAEPGYYD